MRTMDGPCELWRMRKQLALQLAATSFMTYVLCLTSRLPSRFHLSRSTGQIVMSELLPGNDYILIFGDCCSVYIAYCRSSWSRTYFRLQRHSTVPLYPQPG